MLGDNGTPSQHLGLTILCFDSTFIDPFSFKEHKQENTHHLVTIARLALRRYIQGTVGVPVTAQVQNYYSANNVHIYYSGSTQVLLCFMVRPKNNQSHSIDLLLR